MRVRLPPTYGATGQHPVRADDVESSNNYPSGQTSRKDDEYVFCKALVFIKLAQDWARYGDVAGRRTVNARNSCHEGVHP